MTRPALPCRLLSAGVLSLCVAFAGGVAPASAQDQSTKSDVKVADLPWAERAQEVASTEVIISADRLRSLSREISALACHITQDVAPRDSAERLKSAAARFARTLNTLEQDDGADRVSLQQPDQKPLPELAAVKDLWAPLRDAIDTVLETPTDAAALSMLEAGSEVLYDMSSLLFEQAKANYVASPEVTSQDVLLIDVAGQQAALTQHLSFIACQIWDGDRSAKRMGEFSDTTWILEQGVLSLVRGLPSMGILPAPNAQIADELDVARHEWRSMKVFLVGMTESTVPGVARRMLYERLNEEHDRLRGIVRLYADHSRQLY